MNSSCMYCSTPVAHREFCVECDHFHIVRSEMLNDLLAAIEEERLLKLKLKDVQKNRRALERKYDLLWDKMFKQHMNAFR